MQDTVRVDRDKYIGGSDIPVIMGISPFKTRYQLLREKAGLEDDTFEGNIYTEYGQKMEPKIRDYLNTSLGRLFVEGKHYNDIIFNGVKQGIGVRCHTDGEDNDTVVEIKTTSQIYKEVDEYEIYLVQLLYYMKEADKEKGILAVYERPDDFSEEFDAKRLQEFNINIGDYSVLVTKIYDEIVKFVEDREKLINNPFLTEEELLPSDLMEASSKVIILEKKLQEFKEMEKEYERQKESLLKAMQDAGVPSWRTNNGYLITVVDAIPDAEVTQTIVDTELLKEKHPRIYKAISHEETKVKKGKKAYLRITAPKEEKNG